MESIQLWVVLAIGAALAQTLRNTLTQSLSSRISPALNSWSRFAFSLPFAALATGALAYREGIPNLSPSFFALCFATALTQLLGAVALINAFRSGSFGEAIVFHKLEVLVTALFGVLFFQEIPSSLGTVGIAVCMAGVIAINLARKREDGPAEGHMRRAIGFGVAGRWAMLCALLLTITSFTLKAANGLVIDLNPSMSPTGFGAPLQTLFHTTWMEVAILTGWIVLREPASFADVHKVWRRMALIGAASFIGSLGWFWAFSLTIVAYVKAVGQIEALLAVFLGIRLLGEENLKRQIPGVLLVMAGIVLVLVG